MKKVIKIVPKEESGYDYDYWLAKTPAERLEGLAIILSNNIFNPITEKHRKLLRTKITVIKKVLP